MNHTIAPGLVSTMSHFGSAAYSFKPSGVVTYSAGLWGGARAGVALRPFLSELGCLPVSSVVSVPGAIKAMGGVAGDGEHTGGAEVRELPETSSKMLDRMLDQLEWQARSLRDARERDGPPTQSYFEQVRLRK
jgi:NAD(P)H-dependent FMN reductase